MAREPSNNIGGELPNINVEKQGIPEILERISICESNGRQFNEDGTVVRGKVNPLDVGKFQINLYYHEAEARRLGFDLFTEEGNTNYALYLYEHEGTAPWNWSSACWSKL